ncbi:hypothetical protein Pyn_07439 [Prunus yedoensis var. nudiflora]|uniref:Reverse transcriptase zinc-binding domain-containing protein n=1 Tax=Prunus yedoensis var. nudiflora TaxID=2094558 RepID=A0A314UEB1_PRUYE|nr:hypothetical protein Pyn_07439 [Prunus yedoensis var. nudiflora]
MCPFGGWEVETVEHHLLLCSWTNVVWFGAPLSYGVDMWGFCRQIGSWELLIFRALARETQLLLISISFICWKIWKTQCNFIFKGSQIDPRLTINRAMQTCMEYLDAKSRPHVPFWAAQPQLIKLGPLKFGDLQCQIL